MADPRDPLNPMNDPDPYVRPKSETTWRKDTSSGSTWGWIVGGIAVVLVLAFVFGMSGDGSDTASNQINPPPASPTATAPTTPPAANPPAAPSTTGQNPN